MVSRRNGEFKRTILSALAALVAAAVPSLISSAALAETPSGNDAASAEPAKAPVKHEAKKPKKAHAGKAHHAKADAAPAPTKAQDVKAEPKESKGKTAAAPAKGKKIKKTASRAPAGRKKGTKKSDAEAPQRPCLAHPVTVDRMGLEGQSLALVDCHGVPLDGARVELSLLARPWGVARPVMPASPAPLAKHGPRGKHVAVSLPAAPPGVKLVDKGLLARLDAITKRFPNRTISLVSGYRPQSKGSQHQAARALDLRVTGVSNEELVEFCKSLPDTGCGYYPNSSFVHVDVRNPGTGVVTWIDSSGPGESPRYVARWPEPENDPVARLPPPASSLADAKPGADDGDDATHDDASDAAEDTHGPPVDAPEKSAPAREGASDAPAANLPIPSH